MNSVDLEIYITEEICLICMRSWVWSLALHTPKRTNKNPKTARLRLGARGRLPESSRLAWAIQQDPGSKTKQNPKKNKCQGWRNGSRSRANLGTLYVHMEMPQENPLYNYHILIKKLKKKSSSS
jgi:hypothetical protein